MKIILTGALGFTENAIVKFYYINQISLWMDVKIFFQTIAVVIRKEGMYRK